MPPIFINNHIIFRLGPTCPQQGGGLSGLQILWPERYEGLLLTICTSLLRAMYDSKMSLINIDTWELRKKLFCFGFRVAVDKGALSRCFPFAILDRAMP
jgi:hypothetical protein